MRTIKVHKIHTVAILFFISTSVIAGSWYEGGTLHKSSVSRWKAATYENKLATAADWSLISPKIKNIVQKSGDINTTKEFAKELIICIDTATQGLDVSGSTSTIATSCLLLKKWI